MSPPPLPETTSQEGRAGPTAWQAGGAGPPLLLVHGVGLDLHMWEPVARRLEQHRRVLRYDLLGHGASAAPPADLTLAHLSAQVTDLLDALGVEQVDVVGFSLGGLVARELALSRPARVRSLVLLATVHGRSPAEQAGVDGRVREVERGGVAATVEAALERWFTPGFAHARPEVIAAVRGRLLANDRQAYLQLYRLFAAGDATIRGRLHTIRCPTLVATGADDTGSTPAMARALAAAIPGADCVILPGLRHLAPLEAPTAVAGLLEAFLDRR